MGQLIGADYGQRIKGALRRNDFILVIFFRFNSINYIVQKNGMAIAVF